METHFYNTPMTANRNYAEMLAIEKNVIIKGGSHVDVLMSLVNLYKN